MRVEEAFDIRKDPFSDKMTLHQYIGPGGHIVVPDGVEVITFISYDRAGTITGITIPDSVSEIDPQAFRYCKGLADKDGFVIIRNVLYQYFGPGGHVVIPEGVEEICGGAFEGQKKITGITVPDSVKKIDKYTFAECEGMADQNGFVIFRNYLYSYFGKDKRIEIPEGVTEIGPCFLSKVESESSMAAEYHMIYGDDGTNLGSCYLRELIIPDSVKRVDPYLHFGAERTLYNIHASMPVMETIWNLFSPQQKTRECMGYLNATFEPHENFFVLIRAYIKKSKKKFSKLVFQKDDVQMLDRFLHILQNVKLQQIDEYLAACAGKPNLVAYLLNYKKENFTSQQIRDADEEVVEKELGIKEKSVADWRKTFKFSISGGCVEIIGYKGTETNVVIPEKIGKNAVTRIGARAFQERNDLTSIILPDSITHIDSQAFICCTGLTEFTIPASITQLENGTFAGCSELTVMQIPESLTKISTTAFFGCSKVTIHAPAGSYAETYAKENNIPFVAE